MWQWPDERAPAGSATIACPLAELAANMSVEEVLRDYPRLTREDIQAALAYASDAVGSEEIVLAGPRK